MQSVERKNNNTLEKQMELIIENLNEIRKEQINTLMLLQKNHNTYMKKIDKIQEYNKISDMTNQLFEKRLYGIESALKELNK